MTNEGSNPTEPGFRVIRYALVTETFAPEINGVSMTLERLARGLAGRGLRVNVVAPARRNRDKQRITGYTVSEVPGLPIPRYPDLRFGLPCVRRLVRAWRRDRPDIVHVATEGPLGWSAVRAAKRLGIPAVSSFHTNFHSYGRHYGYGALQSVVLWWLYRFHNRTLRTFVPTEQMAERLKSDGVLGLRVMARGVDTELFGPHRRSEELRRSWEVDPETPVAIHVGRLAGEKNLPLIVGAWKRMRERLPDIKLVLVGDGPLRRRLEKACPEAVFAGMRSGEDLAAHYASADCFLFASTTETYGNVVPEAMASGLPVLAYNYAAAGRLIEDGTSGVLVPYEAEEAFLEAAGRFADMRSRWSAMGSAARESVLPHSWDRIVGDYLAELECVLTSDAVSAVPR